MIEATELRSGNYLEYLIGEDGIGWKPTQIDWQDIKWATEKKEDFNKLHQPIPLTEEILDNNLQKGVLSDYAFGGHAFKFRKGILTLADNENYSQSSEKKYVHELQNLIYALTGEEIEIKL